MITSQITGRAIFGQDPAGYTQLTPNPVKYVITQAKRVEFLASAVPFVANTSDNKQDILDYVQTELDTNYMPLVFSDPAASYDVRYEVTNARLDFETPTSDRTIWAQRTWKWYIDVIIKVNVN